MSNDNLGNVVQVHSLQVEQVHLALLERHLIVTAMIEQTTSGITTATKQLDVNTGLGVRPGFLAGVHLDNIVQHCKYGEPVRASRFKTGGRGGDLLTRERN